MNRMAPLPRYFHGLTFLISDQNAPDEGINFRGATLWSGVYPVNRTKILLSGLPPGLEHLLAHRFPDPHIRGIAGGLDVLPVHSSAARPTLRPDLGVARATRCRLNRRLAPRLMSRPRRPRQR